MSQQVADDDFQPLRALNDLLFSPRRCALHRVEGIRRGRQGGTRAVGKAKVKRTLDWHRRTR